MSGLRDPRVRDPQYLGWVAKLPCLACMVRGTVKWGVHVAHLRAGSEEHGKRPTGKAEKPSDIWTLPLCPPHHVGDIRVTRLTQHGMGELEFWAELGIDDPFQVCLDLRAAYERGDPVRPQQWGVAAISKIAAAARRNLEGAHMNEDEVRGHYAALQASGELPDVALSIQQPWAWLMVNGFKPIENRTWRRKTPPSILVHAGKKIDGDAWQALESGLHPATPGEPLPPEVAEAWDRDRENIQTGGFVGAMDLTGEVLTASKDPWFMGPFGYVAANARPLPFLPWRGELGFFKARVSA